MAAGAMHDAFSRNTCSQLKQVLDALRELMTPPDPPKRPIGFVTPEGKGRKASGTRSKTWPRSLAAFALARIDAGG